jgi:signal transduction histidine kinase
MLMRIIKIREKLASQYLNSVSIIGVVIFLFSIWNVGLPTNPSIFIILVFFAILAEYFPVPVWKGTSSLSFPLIYTIDILFGLPVAIITFGLIVILINVINRRPLRLIFFNPAQLVISLAIASYISGVASSQIEVYLTPITYELVNVFIYVLFYYLINNLIVDALLWVRPQTYTFKQWFTKTKLEGAVFLFSFIYSATMELLGNQNRGDIDVFSFLFFFAPLIGITIISTAFAQIQREKTRLKSLFELTTQINHILPSGEVHLLKGYFREFLSIQASALWVRDGNEWSLLYIDGSREGEIPEHLSDEEKQEFLRMREPIISNDRNASLSFSSSFNHVIRSLVYTPLLVNKDLVGVFIAGRSRTKSFISEDVQLLATLSNQLAVLVKTRSLIKEQEKVLILEERNRIARDLHDGIAQTLAGSVFKLESGLKIDQDKPNELKRIIDECIMKLRVSLIDVRQSIYTLRPYPTEQLGLKHAIVNKIESMKQEYGLQILFSERGYHTPYSSMVEKVIFDILQESLQNATKHAKATRINVLISYGKDQIILKVADNGVGFSLLDAMIKARSQPHYGILNMNEQAKTLGAILQIDSSPGNGTEIMLKIRNVIDKEEMQHDQGYVSG